MNAPRDVHEYVLVLRKHNPNVSDVDLTMYLVSLGYSEEEVSKALLDLESRLESPHDIFLNKGEKKIENTSSYLESGENTIVEEKREEPITSFRSSFVEPKLNLIPKHEFLQFEQKAISNIESNTNIKEEEKPKSANLQEVLKKFSYSPKELQDINDDEVEEESEDQDEKTFGVNNKLNQKNPWDNVKGESSQKSYVPYNPISSSQISTPKFTASSKNDVSFAQNSITKKSGILKSIISFIVVVVLLGGGAYGYYNYIHGIFVFNREPIREKYLAGDIVKSFADRDFYIYNSKFSVKIENKDSETVLFDVKKFSSELEVYNRDQEKLKQINILFSRLESYLSVNKKYPARLTQASIPLSNDLNALYEYKNTSGVNDLNFNIITSFETEEVKNIAVENGGEMVDGKIIFNKNSNLPLYKESLMPIVLNLPYQYSNVGSFFANSKSFIPPDLNLTINSSGLFKRGETMADGAYNFGFLYKGGDISFDGVVDVVKKEDDVLVKLKGIFSKLFRQSDFEDVWIKISKDDVEKSSILQGYSDVFKGQVNTKNVGSEQFKKQFKRLIEIASEEKLIVFDNLPKKEIKDFKVFYRYSVSINKDNLSSFYEKASKVLQSEFGDSALFVYNDSIKKDLQKDIIKDFVDVINKNKSLVFVFDQKSRPVLMSFDIKIPLVSEKEAYFKQLRITGDTYFGYDKTLENIKLPEEFVTFDEVFSKLYGTISSSTTSTTTIR